MDPSPPAPRAVKERILEHLQELKQFRWKNLLFLVVSTFINTIGVGLFLVQAKLLDGGFSGTSIFLNFITAQTEFCKANGIPEIPISVFLLVLNIPLFAFGARKMGLNFVLYSLFAVVSYSTWMFFLGSYSISLNNVLLASIFGGILSGIGSGMTIRYGGCLDGVEVMAVWLNKITALSVGVWVMIYNLVIMSLSIPLVGLECALFSIMAYGIGLKAVDFMVEGLDRAKAAIIITEMGQELADHLSAEMGRGATVWQGKGVYGQEDKTVLYFVVNRFEVVRLKQLIYAIDPAAFVSFNEVSEVLGRSGSKKRFQGF